MWSATIDVVQDAYEHSGMTLKLNLGNEGRLLGGNGIYAATWGKGAKYNEYPTFPGWNLYALLTGGFSILADRNSKKGNQYYPRCI